VPSYEITAELEFAEIGEKSVMELDRLEPFGCANPKPVFMSRNVELAGVEPTKNPEHVRLVLMGADGQKRYGMGFGMGEAMAEISLGTRLDLVYSVKSEPWEGRRYTKLYVQDYHESPG
jgi:single-stranded-DNA-specific exonuclease